MMNAHVVGNEEKEADFQERLTQTRAALQAKYGDLYDLDLWMDIGPYALLTTVKEGGGGEVRLVFLGERILRRRPRFSYSETILNTHTCACVAVLGGAL